MFFRAFSYFLTKTMIYDAFLSRIFVSGQVRGALRAGARGILTLFFYIEDPRQRIDFFREGWFYRKSSKSPKFEKIRDSPKIPRDSS